MRRCVAFALICWASTASPQAATRVKSGVERGDSAAIHAAVRRWPNDARDLLADLTTEAAHARPSDADSIMRLAYRIASAYASAWTDSFPLANLNRFARFDRTRRLAKVVADSLRLGGNAAYASKGPTAAIARWRDAFRQSRAIPDSGGMAGALGNIGAGYYRLMEIDSAQLYLERARQLAEAIGDRRTAANAIGTLGSLSKDRGDLRKAAQSYAHSLELRTRIGDVVGASADHNNLGLIAASIGDGKEARRQYAEALRIARDHDLDDAAATALLNLGNLATADANYADAFTDYLDALTLDRKLGSDADAALALQNLALLSVRTGDYRAARDRLKEAFALFARAGTMEDLVQVRRDLAFVDAAMGDLHGALSELRRAEQLLGRAPQSSELAAGVALAHADVLAQLNDYRQAERQYDVARSLYRRARNTMGESEARQGSAILLMRREQYARAASQLDAIGRVQIGAGDRRSAALTRLMLGYAREQEADTLGARTIIAESRDSLHTLGDAIGEAAALVALGDVELDMRSPLAAEREYRNGLTVMQGRTAPAVSWRLHEGLARALRSRGATAEAALEFRLAIADVERMAASLPSVVRRSMFLSDKWRPYAQLALLERERGALADAFAVSERMRARQMLELFGRGAVARPATADSSVLAREETLRRHIAELTQRLEGSVSPTTLRGPDVSDAGTGVTREALAHAQEDYQQVLIALQDENGGAAPHADVIAWRGVASRLRGDQALLEYLVTDSTTLLFVVRSDTIRALDLGVGKAALASLVDFARGTLSRASGSAVAAPWRGPLRRLYAQLVAPAEDAGFLTGVRQLVVVPHAELHYLPFSALVRHGERDEFLVERYDIGYAPSASLWTRFTERSAATNEKVLAVAPRVSALPGSGDEIQAIRSLYGSGVTVLSGPQATEEAFRASAEQFGVIHLATYGVLNQHNPLFSFVELNSDSTHDGRLEVHEVFGLTLHARLVVLSACQTALASGMASDVPAGDDWVGLVRAFLGAGAEHVIATLWAVEDRSTAKVMERLYRRLRGGDATVAALSQAQRETLRNPSTAGPFYWAGFVVVGGANP